MTSVGVMASAVVTGGGGGGTDVLMEPFNNFTAWTAVGTTSIVAGRTGTAAQISNSGSTLSYNLPAPSQSADITVGFAVNWSHGGYSEVMYLRSDGGATEHNKISLNASNGLTFARSTTTLASSANSLITAGSWYYLEVQTKLADAGSFVIVRLNGTEIINATGLDTRNGGTKTVYDQLQFAMFDGRVNKYDDLYITVGAGAPFKGPITIP